MKISWKAGLLFILVLIAVTGVTVAFALDNNQVTLLTLTPDPVKLGYNTTIKYTTSQSGLVSVNVYSESGTSVRNLQNDVSKTAGTYNLTWDGKDGDGLLVPDGYYKVRVDLKDAAGTLIGQLEKLTAAARVPAISNVTDGPNDPFNPLNGEQNTISYTLSSNAKVTVTILRGTVVINTLTANEEKPAGTYTVNWDGTDLTKGAYASDASYYYQIVAESPLVPTFKSTYKSTVTVEKEPPQITGFNATNNPLKLGIASSTISYTLSENAKVTLKILDSGGNVVRTLLDNAAKNAGANSTVWDGKNSVGGTIVPDGQYKAVISAMDNFSKPAIEVPPITITAAAQPSVTAVTANPAMFKASDTAPTQISYTLSKEADVTVQILKGTQVIDTIVNNARQSGTPSVSWNGMVNGTALSDDAYTIQVTAASPLVPTFKTVAKGTITVESGTTSITGLTLTPSPFKIGTGNLTIKYNLSEDAKVTIEILSGTTTIRNLITDAAKAAGANTVLWDGKDNFTQHVIDGTYTVKVRSVDLAGNSSEVSADILSAQAPGITDVISAPEPFNPPVDGSAALSFKVTGNALVTVKILKGMTVVKTIYTDQFMIPGVVNNAYWDGRDSSGGALGDGSYTYQIDAVSPTVATFKNTYKGTVNLEASEPTITPQVAPSVIKYGSTTTLKYTLSEPGTVILQVYDDQGQLVKAFPPEVRTVSGTYSRVWDAKDSQGSQAPTGSYAFKVMVTDNFGKTASAETVFAIGEVPVISNAAVTPGDINLDAMETAAISYTVSTRVYSTVTILDSAGRTYKVVCSNREVTSVDAVYWDGYGSQRQSIPARYTYKIEASSVLGGFKAVPVTGSILVTGTPGVQPKGCADCHQNYPTVHPMTNCAGCHGNNAPLADCAMCHTPKPNHTLYNGLYKYHSEIFDPRICTNCHNDTYSSTVPTHSTDVVAIHDTSLATDCQECHRSSISSEHPRRLDVNGNPYECAICHSSSDPTVQQAVYNGDKNCIICHGPTPDHEVLHETTLIDANCTASCHKASLTQEHMNNPATQTDPLTNQVNAWTCDTCHYNSNPKIINAVRSGNKHCAACHQQAHNMNVAETVPTDIPLYPNYEWTAPQDASIWAGESWVPSEFVAGGRVLISNRRTGVSINDVYMYYSNEMSVRGWNEAEAIPTESAATNFVFVKDKHKVLIWFYGGSSHDDWNELPAGYRIEIVYK